MRFLLIGSFLLLRLLPLHAQQLAVARDTICVTESGKVLKMPWANGLNYSNLSNIDLNFDGINDLLVYDRINHLNMGRFRCFIKNGASGSATYSYSPELSYYFPVVYNWAVALDYNCDGKEDLFCSTNSGIKVYRNEGTVSNPVNFVLVKSILISNYNPGGPPLYGNVYASSVGVPGIADIDNDGDLDLLSFSSQGSLVEYHKNLSKETYGNCDSLNYEYQDYCWGKFAESNCSISLNQCLPKPLQNRPMQINGDKPYHAGSCLTCFDSDSDGDKDLLLGDISCNNVQYAHNTGNSSQALITDTTALYPNFPLKNNTLRIKINNFPCAYYVDVDGDSKKDLVATPSAFGSENTESVWYYRNTSLTGTVNFQFVQKNFLQNEMIEVGQNSFPILFDENGDGKKDLLLGTYGYYQNNTLKGQLTLYRNTGTSSHPSYSLVTRDYASLSSQNLNHVMPTSGDIDGDGDIDLLVGNSTGQIHWLENTAGAGNACNFSIFKNNPFSFTTLSAEAVPQLFDMDQDGKLDLLIGTKNGRINYYRNTGTSSVPSFSLISAAFGDVDVRENMGSFWIDGYAAPFFYREGGLTKLLVGSITGNIFLYTVPPNLSQSFILVNPHVNNYNEGAQSSPFFEDVNGDTKRDLFIGNAAGGLSFFSSASPFVRIEELEPGQVSDKFSVFPVPGKDRLMVSIHDLDFTDALIEISDIGGRHLFSEPLANNQTELSVTSLAPGLYIAKIHFRAEGKNWQLTRKIIISE